MDSPEPSSAFELAEIFADISVDALLLDGDEGPNWIASGELGVVLNSMPELQTLRMHYWKFDEDLCRGLQRRWWMDTSEFPQIKNLCITWARIWDEDRFKEMMSSYFEALEEMELGAQLRINPEDEDEVHYDDNPFVWDPLEEGNDLAIWLEENVPCFDLVDFDYEPKDFDPLEWELW